MQKSYIFILLLCYFILVSCSIEENHYIPENVIDNMYPVYLERTDRLDITKVEEKNSFYVLGKYQDGYIIIQNTLELRGETVEYSLNVYEGVEICMRSSAQIYYYVDYKFERDLLYNVDLGYYYTKGFLTKDDLLDIKAKLDSFKNEDNPYYVFHHFPIK